MSNAALESRPLNRPDTTILIVDDNTSGAQTMQMLLHLEGYNVLVASSGAEALSLFESHSPRVVLLDIGLPDTDGYTIARALRELHGGATAIIIALTGWGTSHDVALAMSAGFDYHFTKPVHFDQLAQALVEHLASSETPA